MRSIKREFLKPLVAPAQRSCAGTALGNIEKIGSRHCISDYETGVGSDKLDVFVSHFENLPD